MSSVQIAADRDYRRSLKRHGFGWRRRNRRKRRSSREVRETRTVSSILSFLTLAVIGVLLLPSWLFGRKKKNKKHKAMHAVRAAHSKGERHIYSNGKRADGATAARSAHASTKREGVMAQEAPDVKRQAVQSGVTVQVIFNDKNQAVQQCELSVSAECPSSAPVQEAMPAGEQTAIQEAVSDKGDMPRTTPRGKGDRYVRKRMTIAGSFYCDKTVLAHLTVGAFLQLVPEPDNPYDANAVQVLFQGQRVGYVPRGDSLPIATYLQMGRKLYGIVSEIRREGTREQCEFEIWAASKNTDGDV